MKEVHLMRSIVYESKSHVQIHLKRTSAGLSGIIVNTKHQGFHLNSNATLNQCTVEKSVFINTQCAVFKV